MQSERCTLNTRNNILSTVVRLGSIFRAMVVVGPKLISLQPGSQIQTVFIVIVVLGYGDDGNMFNSCVHSKFILSLVQIDPFQISRLCK